jgi:hypothetical protein
MKTSTTIRFVLAIVVVTLGFAALWFHEIGGLVVAGFASLALPRRQPVAVSQPPCERYKRNVAIVRAVMLLGILLMVAFAFFATPSVTGDLKRVIFHPVFVIAFWLFFMQAIIRHWIELGGRADA